MTSKGVQDEPLFCHLELFYCHFDQREKSDGGPSSLRSVGMTVVLFLLQRGLALGFIKKE